MMSSDSKTSKDIDIYTEMEVTYLATLIKKKIERNKTLPI